MPQKLKFEDVKAIFEKAGCQLLETTYVNSKTKMKYKCNCGSEKVYEIRLADLMRGTRCPDCRNERMKETNMERFGYESISQIPEKKEAVLAGIKKYVEDKKLKIEDLKVFYKEQGCELLEDVYVNSWTPMRFRCVCGAVHQNTATEFKAGQRCNNLECINRRRSETNMERFGETNYSKTTECQEKIKETNLNKYGVDNYAKTEECKDKSKKTMMSKYGVEHYTQTAEYKEKVKKFCMENYGTEFYFQTEEFKDNSRKTMMSKYGVEHYTQTDEYKERVKIFNMENYGTEFYFQTEEFKIKAKQWCLDNFNVEYYSQTNDMKMKSRETNMIKLGVPVSSMHPDVIAKLKETNMLRYDVPYIMMNKAVKDKANQTILDKYNVINISQVPEIQQKKIETSMARYLVPYPMQDPSIADKSSKNAFGRKEYIFPSGRKEYIQGYENFALDMLVKEYDEFDIIVDRKDVPEVWYWYMDTYRRYFCDIYVKETNTIYEIKSIRTYLLGGREITEKRKACEYLGYTFKLYVFNKDGSIFLEM